MTGNGLLFEFNRSVDAIRRKKVGCSRPGGTDYGATLQYMLAVALLCAGWSIPDARAQMNPPSFELMEATIPQLQWALSAGIVTSHDLVAQYLARIEACDQHGPVLNAFSVTNGNALTEADARDAERRTGAHRGPLNGIPIIIKDRKWHSPND